MRTIILCITIGAAIISFIEYCYANCTINRVIKAAVMESRARRAQQGEEGEQ